MLTISGDRTVLLKVLTRQLSPRSDGVRTRSIADLAPSEVVAVFRDDANSDDLPHTIVVEGIGLREFFAWSATYLAQWSPLTSVIRVVARGNMKEVILNASSGYRVAPGARRALAALTIGEALAEWRLAGEKSLPNVLSLRSTYSYAAAQEIVGGERSMDGVFHDCERVHRVLGLPPRRIPGEQLRSVWQPVADALLGREHASSRRDKIARLVEEVLSEKRLPREGLAEAGLLFHTSEFLDSSGHREDAVIELERWLGSTARLSSPLERFTVGCLGTRLSRGALTHFDVIFDMVHGEPESLLWYSFLSGLLAQEPSRHAVERLIFRLCKEYEGPAAIPLSDVSLDELEVLTNTDGAMPPWVGVGAGYVVVEIRPGVRACFRVHDRGAAGGVNSRAGAAAGDELPDFETLLRQVRTLYYSKVGRSEKKHRR